MHYSTVTKSFKTSFTLDKSIKGLTEIYMNKSLNYPDGYKLTVTNQANDAIDFTTIQGDTENYLQVSLTDMDSLRDGETIKINLTP